MENRLSQTAPTETRSFSHRTPTLDHGPRKRRDARRKIFPVVRGRWRGTSRWGRVEQLLVSLLSNAGESLRQECDAECVGNAANTSEAGRPYKAYECFGVSECIPPRSKLMQMFSRSLGIALALALAVFAS